MSLATEKFEKLLEEKDKLAERGVKVRVIGNMKLLPQNLQKSIAEAMLLTEKNDKYILNVAFAYTSRDEVTHSIETIVKGVEDKDLEVEDLHHSLIDECLYTNKCTPVDLLVRTSGEMRFSDFLLWQVCRLEAILHPHAQSFSFRHQRQFSTSPTRFGRSSPSGTSSPPSSTSNDATTKRCL